MTAMEAGSAQASIRSTGPSRPASVAVRSAAMRRTRGTQRLDPPRREHLRHEPAQPGVLAAVQLEDRGEHQSQPWVVAPVGQPDQPEPGVDVLAGLGACRIADTPA